MYSPGDTISLGFTTQSISGSATDADSTPAASLRRNGTIDGAVSVTITHNATGDYSAALTLPLTYVAGDDVELLVSATVGGTTGKAVFGLGKLSRAGQEIACAVYDASGATWHVATSGSDTSDGKSWKTAFATPTHAAGVASAGDVIVLGPGTFALGNAHLTLPAGVMLAGAGIDRTIITSTQVNTAIVVVTTNCTVQDLTVQGTATPGAGVYQFPIGDNLVDAPGVVIRRVRTISDTDGLYFQAANSLARCYDSYLSSNWDCIFAANGATVELFRTLLKTTGPNSASPLSNGTVQAVSGATVRLWDCAIVSISSNSSPSRSTYGVRTDSIGSSLGTAELYRCSVMVNVVDGTIYDLRMDGGTVIKVSNTAYPSDRVLGTPIVVNTPDTFGGPNSVTLQFHDAGGAPVPNVVFSLANVGFATTDASGVKTISLPAGNFTVKALPASGTLFPDTPITVTGNATFTITCSAVTITPAAAPNQTTGYLTTRDASGNPAAGVTLTFQLINPQQATDSFDQSPFTATSDANALLQVALLQSSQYQARVGTGPWVTFTTGTASTYELPEVLGGYQG